MVGVTKKQTARKSTRNLNTSNLAVDEGEGDKMIRSTPSRKKKKVVEACSERSLNKCTSSSQILEEKSSSLFPDEETGSKWPWCYDEDDKVVVDYEEDSTSRNQEKAKFFTIRRAEQVEARLNLRFPSFVRSIGASNICVGSSLFIPPHIRKYVPKENFMISLIGEKQQVYTVKYLVKKGRLSAGWKGFSDAHKLVEGDALVFQLVKPTQFQVYIVRAYSTAEADGISSLVKQIDSCKETMRSETTTERLSHKLSLTITPQPTGDPRSDNEEAGSEILKDTRFSETMANFEGIENLESFTIVVNGAVIDSQLTDEEKSKYYELCCSQQCLLHINLVDGIDSRLAAGIIGQTISLSDAIRASTSEEEFAAWDNKLNAFKLLGMNVAFLQARVQRLATLVQKNFKYSESYRKVIARIDDVKEKLTTPENKLIVLTCKQFDTEI